MNTIVIVDSGKSGNSGNSRGQLDPFVLMFKDLTHNILAEPNRLDPAATNFADNKVHAEAIEVSVRKIPGAQSFVDITTGSINPFSFYYDCYGSANNTDSASTDLQATTYASFKDTLPVHKLDCVANVASEPNKPNKPKILRCAYITDFSFATYIANRDNRGIAHYSFVTDFATVVPLSILMTTWSHGRVDKPDLSWVRPHIRVYPGVDVVPVQWSTLEIIAACYNNLLTVASGTPIDPVFQTLVDKRIYVLRPATDGAGPFDGVYNNKHLVATVTGTTPTTTTPTASATAKGGRRRTNVKHRLFTDHGVWSVRYTDGGSRTRRTRRTRLVRRTYRR